MTFDTRTAIRVSMDGSVEFRIDESMMGSVKLNIPETSIKGTFIDISKLGCALESPYLIPLHTLIKMDIDTGLFSERSKKEHPQPIIIVGNVRSCIMKSVGRYRLGIFFEKIKKEDIDFLDDFVKSREHKKETHVNTNPEQVPNGVKRAPKDK